MKRLALFFVAVVILAAALPVAAQVPTGTLNGRVTDASGALPGATVTINSENLQGTRIAVTAVNGDYMFAFLPPGDYTVTVELAGFQPVGATVKLSAAQATTFDVLLTESTLTEEILVTGSAEVISASPVAAATITKAMVDELPIGRGIGAAIIAAPGTSNSGPGGNVTISGAQSFENLWTVNGVVVNENVRQQSLPLYIEDAIQETTTSTSGVSAEYGRFAGGVITTLTKSGGNSFTGSFRLGFNNPRWSALRPGEAKAADVTNKTMEATLGGFVLKDHLWFFFAGRDTGDSVTSRQTSITNLAYESVSKSTRLEGKLTFSITPEHRIIGQYFEIDSATSKNSFGTIMDFNSLYDREDPQSLYAVNYTGVLTENFFVEGQYSKRDYIISKGGGSRFTDNIYGTLLLDLSRSSRRYWSPTFCGAGPPQCPDKQRDNENYLAKGSWFLSSATLGSHDITFGYDHFQEFNLEENHQTGSDYRIYTSGAYTDRDPIVPIISPTGRQAYFFYQPQLTRSVGSQMVTNSIYVNDKWRLNNKWSFNVGFRYDFQDSTDSSGATVSDDSRISPRFAASWDVKGNGDMIVNAVAARYVTALAGSGNVGDGASQAGLTSVYLWYRGPAINTDPNNLVSTEEALQTFFDWLASQGGVWTYAENPANWRYSPNYPGVTRVLLDSLKSPYADELSLGLIKRLGSKGMVRADYVHREYGSFYQRLTDTTTGQVSDPSGATFDRTLILNENDVLSRKYDGLHVQGQYRFGNRLTLGGNYALSWNKGNFTGETSSSGPISTTQLSFPEYTRAEWNYPTGYLSTDERHRLRVFGVWTILQHRYHRLNLGAAQFYTTGTPYGAVGSVDSRPSVTNPGYISPPSTVTYYFTSRDAYRLDSIYSTDLSVTYTFIPKLFGRDVEIYVKPEVRNVFNHQNLDGVETQVDSWTQDKTNLNYFNPFTDTPVECPQTTARAECKALGAHWQKRATFGTAIQPSQYQDARTYLVAAGIRF